MKLQWPELGELREFNPQDFQRAFIVPIKSALGQLRQAMGGNLTIQDNQYAAIITLGAIPGTTNATLTSGTEHTFANPLKTMPVGFTPIYAKNTSGTAVSLASCRLNTSRTDGLLGLTAAQDLLGASGDIGESVTSTVLFANKITLTTNTTANVTTLSLNAGTWAVAGAWNFSGTTATKVIGSISLTSATLSNNPSSQIETPTGPTAASEQGFALSGHTIALAASATVYQVTLATFTGGIAAYGRLSATRTKRLDSSSLIVTGILWGG